MVDANQLSPLLNSEGTTTYDGTRKNTWAYWNVNYRVDGAVHASDLSVLLNVYGKSRTGGL